MHEGLDRDDIYIMVEDEFQAIARSFTQHLHHAEYVRMKNRLRDRNASAISTISRPTDSITTMRAETRKKKEAEARATKQKKALDQIKGQAGRPKTGSEDDGSEPEAANDDDPWVGTTLQGLMMSPGTNQTSLTGIEGVRSSTRAAAGYAMAEAQSSQGARTFDVASSKAGTLKDKLSAPPELVNDGDDATTSEDDDDLDAPVIRKKPPPALSSRSSAQSTVKLKTSHHISKDPSTHPKRPPIRNHTLPPLPALSSLRRTDSHPRPTPPKPPTRSILKPAKPLHGLDFYDSLPRPTPLQGDFAKRKMRRLAGLNVKSAGEEREGKGKRTSVSEIPIFLV